MLHGVLNLSEMLDQESKHKIPGTLGHIKPIFKRLKKHIILTKTDYYTELVSILQTSNAPQIDQV